MNTMDEINREQLLGFLIDALDEEERAGVAQELRRRPELRAELALLKKELTPLNGAYRSAAFESDEPTSRLARRTCDRIWAAVDQAQQGEAPSLVLQIADEPTVDEQEILCPSTPSPFSSDATSAAALRAVDEMVRASVPTVASVPKRLARQAEMKKRNARSAQPQEALPLSPRRRFRRDILVSITVGMLIAVLAFPTVNFTKNRVIRYVTQSQVQEINQRIDRFALLQSGLSPFAEIQNGETPPPNITNFGWQEFKPAQIPLLAVHEDWARSPDSPLDLAARAATVQHSVADHSAASKPNTPVSEGKDNLNTETVLGQARSTLFLPGLTSPSIPSNTGLAEITLPNVGQILPVSGNAPLQTVYGQNVLFHNGKIFIRQLPIVPAAK